MIEISGHKIDLSLIINIVYSQEISMFIIND
jgi:hypothetical protein